MLGYRIGPVVGDIADVDADFLTCLQVNIVGASASEDNQFDPVIGEGLSHGFVDDVVDKQAHHCSSLADVQGIRVQAVTHELDVDPQLLSVPFAVGLEEVPVVVPGTVDDHGWEQHDSGKLNLFTIKNKRSMHGLSSLRIGIEDEVRYR